MTEHTPDTPDLAPFVSKEQRKKLVNALSTIPSGTRQKDTALLVPPAGEGSFGDEAMIQALADHLRIRGYTIDVLSSSKWRNVRGVRRVFNFEDLHTETYAHTLSQYERVFIIGADVLDGFYDTPSGPTSQWYLWLAYIGAATGSRVSIVGFSFNSHPKPGSIAMFSFLPKSVRINVRDILSLRRFRQATRLKARLVADAAFLLQPVTDHPSIQAYREWVAQKQHSGGRVIGINLGGHSFGIKAGDHTRRSKVLSTYHAEISQLLEEDASLSVVLLPHDVRGELGDYEMLKDLHDLFRQPLKSRVLFAKDGLSAASVKAIAKDLNVVMSCRMHLAIACLGSGTPVASVVYQNKFEGLYRHFGLRHLTATPEEILKKGGLASAVTSLLQNEATLRSKIKRKLPRVLRLARRNVS